jgi:hypothetical protein
MSTHSLGRIPIAAALAAAVLIGCSSEQTDQQPGQAEMTAPPVPTAMIVAPADGDTVTGPNVQVDLAVENLTLAPAGTDSAGTGHLHLFIDHDLSPVGEAIPMGEGIVHLGKAQSGYLVEGLSSGAHTIIAVIGDWAHVRIPDARADTVRIVVR